MKQGQLSGLLKELGYTEDQVQYHFTGFSITDLDYSFRSSSSDVGYLLPFVTIVRIDE